MTKFVLQEYPDLNNTGRRNVFPKLKRHHTLSTDELVKFMSRYSTSIQPNILRAALDALAQTMAMELADGHNVRIDGLGTFSLSIGFDDDKPTELSSDDDPLLYRHVVPKKVNFRVSERLLGEVKRNAHFERDEEVRVKKLSVSPYSLEERIARALEYIEAHKFMRIEDYARLNNLSRTAASVELKTIIDDPESPFATEGKGTHKVWVRK